MLRIFGKRQFSNAWRFMPLAVAIALTSGCAIVGFGGSLKLNITDQQTRTLAIEVSAGDAESLIFEIDARGETEIGVGSVSIDRYVLQRTSFGSSSTTGYFLCPKPCTDPLSAYLVAYSPEQLFTSSGELELKFRVVRADGTDEEVTRTIAGEMLPALWQDPKIQAAASSR
jgi:hypothetical protein